MFHFTERMIEAHVCICFVAYKVYKELERIVRIEKIGLSVDKVLSIAKTITTISIKMANSHKSFTKTLFLTDDQRKIQPLLEDSLPSD